MQHSGRTTCGALHPHNLEPEDRAHMAGEMPPIVSQELVPLSGRTSGRP